MSRKANTVEIDPDQFRVDYRVLSQNDLMRKYGITSTTLMKLIRQHVPPNERYSVRLRTQNVKLNRQHQALMKRRQTALNKRTATAGMLSVDAAN